jgi:hypothetical protein
VADGFPFYNFYLYFKFRDMKKLPKSHFWQWFTKHNSEYLQLAKKSKKETKYWLNEMTAHLRAYYKFLEFSLSVSEDRKSGTLIITVDGKGMYFRRVDALVAQAPSIPGWTVKALEDPFPIDFMIGKEIEETGADPRELYFQTDDMDTTPLCLTIYHPLYTKEKRYEFYDLARNAVYNLLGERSFGNDIRNIHLEPLSWALEDQIAKIETLPEYIGSLKSSIIVDGTGMLRGMK